ncbi:ATP-dependent RNA helicase DDX49/DBP8 [Nematocida sp. ERTm5]|nr:ATP-dependent RNA helicase DDX49/DBP8 [Nematocida sp. ERTm5]
MVFSVQEEINDILKRIGFKEKTPIQKKLLPFTEKKDIIGLSETGTGKTACFVIPLIESLAEDPYGVHSLILTPTRELAVQTKEKVDTMGSYFGITCEIIHGGMDVHKQAARLQKKPHIVIATPGRLAAMFCSEDNVSVFKRIKKIALDEADLLLNSDQSPAIYTILSELLKRTPKAQLLLFSATDIVPKIAIKVHEQGRQYQKDSESAFVADEQLGGEKEGQKEKENNVNTEGTVVLEKDSRKEACDSGEKKEKEAHSGVSMSEDEIVEKTICPEIWKLILARDIRTVDTRQSPIPKTITQEYALVHRQSKDAHLATLLLEEYKDSKVIVFMNRADNCAILSEVLQELGINAVGLSRCTDNKTRHTSFFRFRSGLARVLLTTDVLSRGLDVKDVGCVINYDLPNHYTDYIHRIGRTGRIQQKGHALSFVTAADMAILRNIQAKTSTEIAEKELRPFTTARLMNKITTHREFIMSRIEKTIFKSKNR